MEKKELIELIGKMSIRDKALELSQVSPAFYGEDGSTETGPASELGITPQEGYQTNSVLNYFGADRVKKIKQ